MCAWSQYCLISITTIAATITSISHQLSWIQVLLFSSACTSRIVAVVFLSVFQLIFTTGNQTCTHLHHQLILWRHITTVNMLPYARPPSRPFTSSPNDPHDTSRHNVVTQDFATAQHINAIHSQQLKNYHQAGEWWLLVVVVRVMLFVWAEMCANEFCVYIRLVKCTSLIDNMFCCYCTCICCLKF